jgi:hypothetical protein
MALSLLKMRVFSKYHPSVPERNTAVKKIRIFFQQFIIQQSGQYSNLYIAALLQGFFCSIIILVSLRPEVQGRLWRKMVSKVELIAARKLQSIDY